MSGTMVYFVNLKESQEITSVWERAAFP